MSKVKYISDGFHLLWEKTMQAEGTRKGIKANRKEKEEGGNREINSLYT